MIEILMNGGEDSNPKVIDWGELLDPKSNTNDYGPIHMGG